jgi:hypothetical protein
MEQHRGFEHRTIGFVCVWIRADEIELEEVGEAE